MSSDSTAAALLGIHALTALHPGAGSAMGTVDLPVQRERHTGWPNIAGSTLKGILRDACRDLQKSNFQDDPADEKGNIKHTRRDKANADEAITLLFGPAHATTSEHAGSVSVTDARLLAYPVRSLKGVFAWVTCPGVMERFARDAGIAGVTTVDFAKLKPAAPLSAMIPTGCPCEIKSKDDKGQAKSSILLEEFKLNVVEGNPEPWAVNVANLLFAEKPEYAATKARFAKHLIVAHDDDFTHFVKYATEVTARIGLNYETKTVKDGALFYQEFLPTESLFYSVVLVNQARTRTAGPESGAKLLEKLALMIGQKPMLQIGGDETTGKGFCSVRLNQGGAA